MAEAKPDLPVRPSTTWASGSTSNPPSGAAAARSRFPQRQSSRPDYSQSPKPRPLDRRRSSILSFTSLEDSDIINPRTRRSTRGQEEDGEATHWHSTPLAFAILPAIGGLLFKNGSAFTTDALLLILAAIFMNWSIRLPWDWYYSAQVLLKDVDQDYENTILEEDEPDENAIETGSSVEDSPKTAAKDGKAKSDPQSTVQPSSAREEAAAALRKQELLALGAIFTFPVMAAYLLHVIRAQLSLPSTSLVSDYNISIFVLAAEIMPCRQVIRLVANRTLHLQRTATGLEEPYFSTVQEKTAISDLMSRIAELEGKLANHQVVPPTISIAQKADVSDLSTEMKKRYEPRLEGLERAVRRYEKRSTTLAMLTDQRLNSLETRLQEALSLAAVAAQHSQRRGFVTMALETLSTIISMPLKLVWSLFVWPFLVLEDLYDKIKTALLGPVPPGPTKKRPKDGSVTDEKVKLKSSMRKIVR